MDLAPDLASNIAKLAQGSIALANRFAQEEDLLAKWQEARDIVRSLAGPDISQVFMVAETIEPAADLFINMLEIILRDILIYKSTENKDLVIIPENIALASEFKIRDLNRLKETINYINNLKDYFRRYINSKLISINIARDIWQTLH